MSAEISADASSVSVQIQKRIQIRYGRKIVGVGIQKMLCVGRNAENIIKPTYFYLKVSRVNVSSSNFSQVCMFCDADRSKLVPESMRPGGFPGGTIVDNLTKNQKVNIYY